MQYPGNAALSDDIKARIVATFEQTLESARQGKRQEAQLGCDFILKLDTEFQPARKLADLLRSMDSATSEPEPPPVDHLGTMNALLGERRFADLVKYATENMEAVSQNPALQKLAGDASSRLEAEPYVASFLQSAREAIAKGEMQQVAGLLAKAKALDPLHPGIASLEQLTSAQADPSATVKIPLDFSLDPEGPKEGVDLKEQVAASPAVPPSPAPPSPTPPSPTLPNQGSGAPTPAAPTPAASTPPVQPPPSTLPDDPLAAFDLDESPFPAMDAAPSPPVTPPPASPPSVTPPSLGEAELGSPFEGALPPAAGSGSTGSAAEPDDPFAALEADLGSSGLGAEADDDPFAAFSLGPSGEGDQLPSLDDDIFGSMAEELSPEAALGTDDEIPDSGDARINELLADGQKAFKQGDHQGAIDAWSRIFLIDVDNEEASRRIEEARKLKAEGERQVEEVYHDGLTAWEQGDVAKARAAFEQVIELQPSHVAATELLEQIATAGAEGVPLPPVDSSPGGADLPGPPAPPSGDADLLEEIMVPPEPGSVSAKSSGAGDPAAKGGGKRSRKFLGIGLAVLLLVAAGAAYLFMNRASFFPNTGEDESVQTAKPDPIERARKMYESGKEKLAISQLKRIPAKNDQYEAAQALIAEWSAEKEPVIEETELSPELVAQRERLMAEARSYRDSREFLRVRSALEKAGQIAPLEGDELLLTEEVKEGLRPFGGQLQMIKDRQWDEALRDLWRFHLEDRTNPDIVHLIVNCYYNLGVRDLQRGNQSGAALNFDEAFELAPQDQDAQRHALFAKTYSRRSPDLLYRIYVKYLPYR